MGGFGGIWRNFEELWEVLGGFGRILRSFEEFWEVLGGFGGIWMSLEEFGGNSQRPLHAISVCREFPVISQIISVDFLEEKSV